MMNRRLNGAVILACGAALASATPVAAQCCLSEFFAGCCVKAPVYAVAPVAAPVMAPVVAPVAAPPPPVMVPVQQTSYVPETTYRTQYQNVPVTTYKPSCEIDPCTGCARECMQPVTQYVQQAVNVPVTQYRAVTTTKYVQMQPGYAAGQGVAPAPYAAPAAPAASPFAAPVQTTPQAWGAAGPDVPPQLVPNAAPPALPAGAAPPATYQQPITPQTGTYMPIVPPAAGQPALQSTQPPALAPTPALKPIPELPRSGGQPPAAAQPPASGSQYAPVQSPTGGNAAGTFTPGGNVPQPTTNGTGTAPSLQPSGTAPNGMPIVPGEGPKASTNAFPRLLAPTGHTTAWRPDVAPGGWQPARGGYPTAALPVRLQQ